MQYKKQKPICLITNGLKKNYKKSYFTSLKLETLLPLETVRK